MPLDCGVCAKTISRTYNDYIECSGACKRNFHIECVNMSVIEFTDLKSKNLNKKWCCSSCVLDQSGSNRGLPLRSANDALVVSSEKPSSVIAGLESSIGEKILSEISSINARLGKMETAWDRINALQTECTQLNSKMSSLEEDHQVMKLELSEVKDKLKTTEICMKALEEKIISGEASSDRRLNELEDRGRFNNIEIRGLPETQKEDLLALFMSISKLIKVSIIASDVQLVHRVASRLKCRPLIVQLGDCGLRRRWLECARKAGSVKVKDVDRQLPNGDGTVYFDEHLTLRKKILLAEARRFKKSGAIKYLWVRDSRILTRKDDNCPIIHINSTADLAKLN